MIIISDTSPLTNLAAIGQLDLLYQLYEEIIIPKAVYNELVKAKTNKPVPGALEVQSLLWIKTQSINNDFQLIELLSNYNNIHQGEAEAIILALELGANILLMDEKRGRELAVFYNLKVTGLLGILLQAKHQKIIVSVKPVLDELIQKADFRISKILYQALLKEANE